MRIQVPSFLKTKKGFVGALLFFYGAVHAAFSAFQDAAYATSKWGMIVNFLASGVGNLLVVVGGILLILWAIFTQRPETAQTRDIVSEDASNQKIQRLRAERDALKEEKRQNLQNQRRERIEDWRSTIHNFNFDSSERFAGTDTYSQMKPHLQPGIIEMFETPRMLYVGNEARGDSAYKYTLLDEIARVEKEWGLV